MSRARLTASLDLSQGESAIIRVMTFQGYALATRAASSSAARSVSGRRQGRLRRQAGSGSRGERECRARPRRSDEAELMSTRPPIAGQKRTCRWVRVGPKHKVAALQPAAREQEPRGRQSVERTALAGWQVNTINKRTVGVATDDQAQASTLTRPVTSAALITQ